MKIENTNRTRLLIAVDILEQCNRANLNKEDYRAMFISEYEKRTGDHQASSVFDSLMFIIAD